MNKTNQKQNSIDFLQQPKKTKRQRGETNTQDPNFFDFPKFSQQPNTQQTQPKRNLKK